VPSLPFHNHLSFARRYMREALRERRREASVPVRPAAYRPTPSNWPPDRLTVSWLGHATVLLNFFGTWIVTDPALESRIGIGRGIAKFGPRRLIAPALGPRELPEPEIVLLSHAPMDHTDLGTLAALPRHTHAIVQPGNRDLVRRFRQVDELPWGDSTTVAGVRIESVPVRHWGARMITDRHRGFGGYLLEKNGARVLFAGDTAYTPSFTALRGRGPIDLAIMPIGAYDPWIANHASPEEAWRMSRDMGAQYFLPVHHSTFRLSREPVDEPVARLLAAADPERRRVVLTEVGETWTLPDGASSEEP
jgi:L-ascorbate metabolism protein UlaG (beta-lactamase superfamily)